MNEQAQETRENDEARNHQAEQQEDTTGNALAQQLSDTGGGITVNGIQIRSFGELYRFSITLAKSKMVPKDYADDPDSVFVAINMGHEVGLAPMQAIQNIANINGRPSVWGDAALAICKRNPEWGGIKETDDGETATCTVGRFERRGDGRVHYHEVTHTFSNEDAKQAGLFDKGGPWKTYTRRMRQMRARSWSLRDMYADALRGLHFAEEARDIIDVEAQVVDDTKPLKSGDAPESEPARGVSGAREKLRKNREQRGEKSGGQAQGGGIPAECRELVERMNKASTKDELAEIEVEVRQGWEAFKKPAKEALASARDAARERLAD